MMLVGRMTNHSLFSALVWCRYFKAIVSTNFNGNLLTCKTKNYTIVKMKRALEFHREVQSSSKNDIFHQEAGSILETQPHE